MRPLSKHHRRALTALLLAGSGAALLGGCLLNRAGIGDSGQGGAGGMGGMGGLGGLGGMGGGMDSTGGQGGIAPCGNGTLDEGEACDDGNTLSGDGCSAMCTFDAADSCPPTSQIPLTPGVQVQLLGTTFGASHEIAPSCNDLAWSEVVYEVVPEETGTLQILLTGSFERALFVRDTCPAVDLVCEVLSSSDTATARLPVLGNKPYLVFVDANVPDSNTTFALSMLLLNCGDGIRDYNEECDDGNEIDGDGCSASCLVECDGGYKRSDNHCYRYINAAMTWSDARNNCLAIGPGYDLVAVSSSSERTFIDNNIDPSGSVWTGGNDQAREGAFVWSNGEPFDFDGWLNDEPNGGTGENCLEQVDIFGFSNDRFNDLSCTATLRSICELTPAGT